MLNNLKAVVSATANVWTGFRPELSIGDCPVCAQHQALGAGQLVKNPIPRVPVHCVPVHERETTPASPSNHQETDEYEETDDSNGRADTNTADPISPAATAPTTSMNSTHTDNQISQFLIVGEFNTPQPLASSTFTPTMVDSTTSPMDKHYSIFLAQSYEKKTGRTLHSSRGTSSYKFREKKTLPESPASRHLQNKRPAHRPQENCDPQERK